MLNKRSQEKNMLKLKVVIPTLIALVMAIGCGSSDTAAATTTTGGGTTGTTTPPKATNAMVGAWKLNVTPEMMKGAPAGAKAPEVMMNFKDDNTFEASVKLGTTESKASGTYKLEGNKLTLDTKMDDGKESKSPPETVELAADMKSFDLPNSNGMGKMIKQ